MPKPAESNVTARTTRILQHFFADFRQRDIHYIEHAVDIILLDDQRRREYSHVDDWPNKQAAGLAFLVEPHTKLQINSKPRLFGAF